MSLNPFNLSKQGYLWPGLLLVIVAIFVGNMAFYYPFISDDSLISLRYSQRLLQGLGLTWNSNEIPVEGYSNLLWVLLTAALGVVFNDLVLAVRVLGILCMSSVIMAVMYAYQPRTSQQAFWPVFVTLAFFVLSGPAAIWAVGGLEQALVAALLAWTLALLSRLLAQPQQQQTSAKLYAVGCLLAGLALTRPDGPIFSVTVAGAWLLTYGLSKTSFVQMFKMIGIPALAYLLQLAFRLNYYGEWVPNTALVKVSPSLSHWIEGLRYLLGAVNSWEPFSSVLLLSMLVCLVKKIQSSQVWLLILPFAAWGAYVVFIGGDIFPGYRHGVPLLVLLTFMLLFLLNQVWPFLSMMVGQGKIVFALCLVLLLYGFNQLEDEQNKGAYYERWEWDGQAIAQVLKAAFYEKQPLFAVTAAGCLPFWSQLPALDMLGLNDHHIPRHPPEHFGHGKLGHELGDGRYVLDRKPDIISFCGPHGSLEPCFLSGQQMVKYPEFALNYSPVWIKAAQPVAMTSILWMRQTSEKVGLQTFDEQTMLPAYFFSTSEQAAHLNESQQIVLTLPANTSVMFKNLRPTRAIQQALAFTSQGLAQGLQADVSLQGNGDYQVSVTNAADNPVDLLHVAFVY